MMEDVRSWVDRIVNIEERDIRERGRVERFGNGGLFGLNLRCL